MELFVFPSPCWLLAITLFHDCIPKHMPRPTAQTLLLTGILRAFGDHQAMADDSRLKIYCSDQSLTRSLQSPPSTHSSEVLDWLHELVHLLTDVSTPYFHQSGVRTFSLGLTSSELGMYISQHYLRTGISPSDLSPSEFSSRESSFALSECLPVDLLRDTWTRRDFFPELPFLPPLKLETSRYVFSRPKRPEILTAPSAQILLSGRMLPFVLPPKS